MDIMDEAPEFNSEQLPGIFGPLPYDIVLKIISHLNQKDCLNCMAVCRSWYSFVPHCSHGVWGILSLKGDGPHGNNKRWIRCIGIHTRTVVLQRFRDEQDLFHALETLVDYGCTRIESLDFIDCTITTSHIFLSLLKQVAHYSTQLSFSNHPFPKLPFLHVLSDACPRLDRFTFLQAHSNHKPSSMDVSILPPISPQCTNLTHLHIETVINKRLALLPILQKSPHLQFLSYGRVTGILMSRYNDPQQPSSIMTDLDQLFRWCPKLVYLEINARLYSMYRDEWIRRIEASSTGQTGLRCFITSEAEDFGPVEIGPLLKRHAKTLEFLCLSVYSAQANWSPVFSELCAPKLKVLLCDGILYEDAAMTALTSHATVLEELNLEADDDVHLNMPNLLKQFKRLKRLELGRMELDYYDGVMAPGAPARLFRHLATHNRHLYDIRLEGVKDINDEVLHAITELPSLKVLTIAFATSNDYSDGGLCEFSRLLTRTAIESLTLLYVRALPRVVLTALGDLPHLTSFQATCRIFHYLYVNSSALVQMLGKTRSLVSVALRGMQLTDTDDEVMTFLEREVHHYRATNRAEVGNYYDVVLHAVG
ncbi:hypothetical protein BJV82DRAFT_667926 [Fennellomyces sp. T-0311]|nr:hypothetical protein BJV82DRAFT_667926 [Fennellomyces sp. T-0311]